MTYQQKGEAIVINYFDGRRKINCLCSFAFLASPSYNSVHNRYSFAPKRRRKKGFSLKTCHLYIEEPFSSYYYVLYHRVPSFTFLSDPVWSQNISHFVYLRSSGFHMRASHFLISRADCSARCFIVYLSTPDEFVSLSPMNQYGLLLKTIFRLGWLY